MYLLPNNKSHWPATVLLRGLLTIIFIAWLAMVMAKYDEKKTDINNKPPPSNIVLEQLALPPVPSHKPEPKTKPAAKSQAAALSSPAKQALVPVEPTTKVIKKAPPITKQQINQVYQQLTDDGVDIQIAWPQSANDRQAALHFMYQCAGMQFAVLDGKHITQLKQTPLSDYSIWIRVAQGSLSKKEHNWLNAYALTGTPIRLFPRQIDWRLADYLANALKGQPFASLRAKYQVSNQTLHLTQIQLNNQAITGSWTLYQGECK